MAKWNPIFVLPNLYLKEAIDSEYVAIAPTSDPRCKSIAQSHPGFAPFLSSFTDACQRPVNPSVLITRDDAPSWVMAMDAISSFRDAISISAVTLSRSLTILYPKVHPHQYSTFFEFYAWAFGRDESILTTNNPSLWGVEQYQDVKGQSTAGLPVSQWDAPEFDDVLLRVLLAEWKHRFSAEMPSWRSLALFRSLNMANAAAQVPGVVGITSQSLGRSISLWVSAAEILAHPGVRKSGLAEVYRVIDQVAWLTKACQERTYTCHEGGRKNMPKRNLACWVYGNLYQARNDYLHGNAIADDRLVLPSGQSMFMFAQPLYRLLLTGFLGIELYGPFKKRSMAEGWYDEPSWRLKHHFESLQGKHELALARVLKPPERRMARKAER